MGFGVVVDENMEMKGKWDEENVPKRDRTRHVIQADFAR